MRIFSLLLFGLLTAASPAFAQSATNDSSGLGNYNFSTINGGMQTPGARPKSDIGLGNSGLGNGGIDTGYGIGSRNAATGLGVNGSGLSEGASNLPSPEAKLPAPSGTLRPMH
jgi:hypothetical protein